MIFIGLFVFQELAMRQLVFQEKQCGQRDAIDKGDILARRHNLDLMATTFVSWRRQSCKQRFIASQLASLERLSIMRAFQQWKAYVSHKVRMHIFWVWRLKTTHPCLYTGYMEIIGKIVTNDEQFSFMKFEFRQSLMLANKCFINSYLSNR